MPGVNRASVSVSQVRPASTLQTQSKPPHSFSLSWALPIILVSAWLNGGHISRLHSLWHCMCMCVCAGRVFLGDSCTLSALSNPWQRQVLTVLQIIIILELSSFFNTAAGLLMLNQCFSCYVHGWHRIGTCWCSIVSVTTAQRRTKAVSYIVNNSSHGGPTKVVLLLCLA